ncbi:MAG: nicotinate-nucleotide--dimethylbenzimidazole phosphoribosyltransferase [Magnetococcales bacterium]|nr:nicotinate-nucleotide--dimethylbenzimidazole phosphoribosyltransferase [Magnetococcales bacterium]NGZ26386.1 nicotinate-nucleotide--dimethylbenzimidazole phosphoribosyltransferase [Magnetococcales bacterium]
MTPHWFRDPLTTLSPEWLKRAQNRQNQLTKPPGSLGILEQLAIRLSAMQKSDTPTLEGARIAVFAADHGIAASGDISAFPQAVTVEMIRNFSRGGAAISVMARHLNAVLEVIDVGAATDVGPLPGVISRRVANGTADFRNQAAMTPVQFEQALMAGREAVYRAVQSGCSIFIAGEMGIGNTTASAAVICSLLSLSPEQVVGPGTGVNADGIKRKQAAIQTALDRHARFLTSPLEILRYLGGLEIAAMCGAYVACAQVGMPAIVDGFIASAAALVAVSEKKGVRDWLFFSHRSAEPGQYPVFQALGVQPLLQMDMRLGEGTGAAAALPLLRLACALHGQMATFAEAGVSQG